jgi:hypothetical protein
MESENKGRENETKRRGLQYFPICIDPQSREIKENFTHTCTCEILGILGDVISDNQMLHNNMWY